MAIFQKATGTCTGRGFSGVDATGYLAAFKAWVVLATGSGGPAWTILLDKSTLPALTTFTVPDHTNDKCYKTAHGMYTGDILRVSNVGGALPGNLSAGTDYYVIKVDADNFYLATSMANAQVGTRRDITSAGSGTNSYQEVGPYIVVSNVASPAINEAALILRVGYVTSEAGKIRVQHCLSFDTTNKILYGYWGGQYVNTADSALFVYDFRGGDECMILQSRQDTTWSTSGVDTWLGNTNFVEDTTKTGTLASGVSAGSSVVLQLGAGQATNFTLNNYYYIYDFNGHSWVNYCKVTNVNTGTDQITVDSISVNFPTGSVIAAYAHRFFNFGGSCYPNSWVPRMNGGYYTGGNGNITPATSKIPYVSGTSGYAFYDQNTTMVSGSAGGFFLNTVLDTMNPDDLGYYACQRPLIFERSRENDNDYYGEGPTGMNRFYGTSKNTYVVRTGSMQVGTQGKIIGGKNYLYFKAFSVSTGLSVMTGTTYSATYCLLFLDTISSS